MCPLSPPGELHREDDLDQEYRHRQQPIHVPISVVKEHAGQTKAGGLNVRILCTNKPPASSFQHTVEICLVAAQTHSRLSRRVSLEDVLPMEARITLVVPFGMSKNNEILLFCKLCLFGLRTSGIST